MHLDRPQTKPKQEGTIALINVVFLMLIFFLIAGTLAPPVDRSVEPVEAQSGEPAPPPDALFLREDGTFSSGGNETDLDRWLASVSKDETALRIFADRRSKAKALIETAAALEAKSGRPVRIVTLRVGQ